MAQARQLEANIADAVATAQLAAKARSHAHPEDTIRMPESSHLHAMAEHKLRGEELHVNWEKRCASLEGQLDILRGQLAEQELKFLREFKNTVVHMVQNDLRGVF